ncbi:GntR family transcriptional regulator [Variovorax boronicumulans]|uniref:GntR family transcriptional regulator n=1 Tax=Variovorax boronicumulans TaxID=436515 RepID=A0AAW8E278_9BURK|nr:GntR family transcriptional regulator [Variovorax boronicumulans]MDP9880693.1 GntR family transcriptional regulator [Variovorax boronicumulans]MDP9910217.1 GntR family transcriptional regulator [Variovorax boronicumulans]MDP9920240.1 GntR family transcriptional regulator [Variovorax boronicumulans]MDP9925980.1 GntR family transcriptional regulator [Variovorax boronicumulans]
MQITQTQAAGGPPRYADSPMPRYLQVADLLRQRIARGTWPEGHRLPSLEELVAEFGVARVTVRQAVELLARDGLVSPQQGRGTFVTGRPPNERWLSVVTTLDALARVYRDTEPQIVNIDEATSAPALRPGEGVAAERYVYMRRVHSRDGKPYCVIDIHLDERIFRRSPKRFREETVIPLLTSMKSVKIAKAHQVLTIGTADMEVARLIDVPLNAPVAEVRRVFRDPDDRVIYLGEVVYRGDAIHVEMDLKP